MRASHALLLSGLSWLAPGQVTTSQYDNARTGANTHETILTPKNVNPRQFGKQFTIHVDGDVYAQPLYLPQLQIPGKGVHSVIFVATEHDSVYALDAAGQPNAPLWQHSFLDTNAGVKTIPANDVLCPFITPEIGITSTPVIDAVSGTIYVLARTREDHGWYKPDEYVQKLHALDIATGAERFGGPVTIQATVPGKGEGSSWGRVRFDPLHENPRAALLAANGNVYLTWASSCDVGPYHGWVMAYAAHTLAQAAVFNVSPDADAGGMWLGDTGPAADNEGNIYVSTGNGRFDAASGGRDFGDSVLKLGPNLTLLDWFTPFNQQELNQRDMDLGSGGPVLPPDQPGDHSHQLVVAGKAGVLYALDRDHLGRYGSGRDSGVVDSFRLGGGEFGAPAYWNGHLYALPGKNIVRDFPMRNGVLSRIPASMGPEVFSDSGATPSISADGNRNGIVWALESKGWRSPDQAAVLHAYDALDVSKELYRSDENGRDGAGRTLRFGIPTVANGRVYVGTKAQVDVYGLLSGK